MQQGVTLGDSGFTRAASFLSGAGMIVFSLLTIGHFFAANYPASIWEGSFCDISAFLNCDSSAYSPISALAGVPLGFFGVMVGGLVCLGAVFPSPALERTNKTIALFNAIGVVGLFFYSVAYLGSLCLLCTGYYLFALASFALFWRYGIDGRAGLAGRWLRPSFRHLTSFAVVTLFGAYGSSLFHEAKREAASGGVAARIVEEYFSLPTVPSPSFISLYMTVRSTERFEDAPIRIIEYGDFLCTDCLYFQKQLLRLKLEFAGQMNVAFQFFPFDAQCNQVVEKDKHPGSCDLSYIAAHDPSRFVEIHDEIFANLEAARDPEWRLALARRYGVEAALTDSATRAMVGRIIETGTEYKKTSEEYSHGIRSTPTLILNDWMVIGTFPYEQLRAIFQALADEHERGEGRKFIESWVEE